MTNFTAAALFGKLNKLAYRSIESATNFCKLRGTLALPISQSIVPSHLYVYQRTPWMSATAQNSRNVVTVNDAAGDERPVCQVRPRASRWQLIDGPEY